MNSLAAFAIYPLAIPLYREANLPRRLIPGSYCLGAFVSILPLVVVIVALYVFTRKINFDVTSGTALALLLACIVTVICNFKKLLEQLSGTDKNIKNFILRSLNEGCGMTHKDSYNDIGMVTCIIPLIGLIVITILGTFGVV
jgi:H+/gluconate symporter-like permease